MTAQTGLRPHSTATASAAAVFMFVAGMLVIACRDDSSSVTGVYTPVPHPGVIGGGTECDDSYAWVEELHMQHDSTELVSPTVCWEYSDSTSVTVQIRYAFLTSGHDGWHTLRLFQRDYRCTVPERGDSDFELLDSAYVEDP